MKKELIKKNLDFFVKNYHLTIDSANKSDIIILAQKEKERTGNEEKVIS